MNSTNILAAILAILTLLLLVGLACRNQSHNTNSPPSSTPAPSAQVTSPSVTPNQPSDPALRAKLLKRISQHGDINDPATPKPLVTLEEFFEGNNDFASIGYNLADAPAPHEFFAMLKQIRARPGVTDFRVEVKDLEDPEGWPATDTVWIITTASREEVRNWIPERIKPDDILADIGPATGKKEALTVPPGSHTWGLWWD